jgi:hypothetical protein
MARIVINTVRVNPKPCFSREINPHTDATYEALLAITAADQGASRRTSVSTAASKRRRADSGARDAITLPRAIPGNEPTSSEASRKRSSALSRMIKEVTKNKSTSRAGGETTVSDPRSLQRPDGQLLVRLPDRFGDLAPCRGTIVLGLTPE